MGDSPEGPLTPFTETEILLARMGDDEGRMMELISDLSLSELEELKGHLDSLSCTINTMCMVRRAGGAP